MSVGDRRVFAFKVTATFCVIGFVLWLIHEHGSFDLALLTTVDAAALGTAFALSALLAAVKAAKWRSAVNDVAAAPYLSYGHAVKGYLGAMPLAIMTPGKIGDVSRIIFMPIHQRRIQIGVLSTLVDKITDAVALCLWLALAVIVVFSDPVFSVAAGVTVLMIFAMSRPLLTLTLVFFIRIGPGRIRFRHSVLRALVAVRRLSTPRLLALTAFGVTAFGIEWLQYWLVFNAFGPLGDGFSWFVMVLAMCLVTFVGLLQITFAGVGTREIVSVFLLSEHAPALVIAVGTLLVLVFDQLIPSLLGLPIKPLIAQSPPRDQRKLAGCRGKSADEL